MNNSVDDSELYIIANKEVDTNTQDDALWRKAMALTAGNKEKAKYKYLKLRVQQLKKTGVPKSKANPEPKINPIKKEKQTSTDNKYEEKRIAEIDEALNKKNKPAEDKSDDKNMLKGIILMLAIIAVVVWVININQSSNSSKSTYVEKAPKSHTSSNSNYSRTSYDDKYSLTIDTLPTNATVKIMNITPKYSYGMYLKQGDYKVQVSAYGYTTKTVWVSLKEDISKYIVLSKNNYTAPAVDYDFPKTTFKNNKFSVNVTTVPAYATIKITNIKPKFYQGMRLKKGKYNVSVSKKGYKTYKGYFELTQNSSYTVTLEKKKADQRYPLTINVTPSGAKVQIMNINPKYYDGIMLKKGVYNIRVSKYGYETQTGTANPFEYATYNVILKKKQNSSYNRQNYQNNSNKVQMPANAQLDIYGSGWVCRSGYYKSGNQCVPVGR